MNTGQEYIIEQRDFLLDQIEKFSQVIAAVVSGKKLAQKVDVSVEQRLSELVGLPSDFFQESNVHLLGQIAPFIDDDNKKAILAKTLIAKNPHIYSALAEKIISAIEITRLDPRIKKMVFSNVADKEV